MDNNNNSAANKASCGEKPPTRQLITPSNWDLLLRCGHVDNTRSSITQGYEIVDEVKILPNGPMGRAHNPLVAASDGEARKNTSGSKGKAPVDRTSSAVTSSSSSGINTASKTLWSQEEIDELLRLRCHGLTYPAIAKDHLPGRDLKAIQLKFAKLKKITPYKERWEKYKGRQGKNVMEEEEIDKEDDEDDYEPPDEEQRNNHGQGGPGGPSGSGPQGGTQAVQVK